MTWWQREFCEALEQAPRYLYEPYMSRVVRAGERLLLTYRALGELAKGSTPPAWNILRKTHTFDHMLRDLQRDRLNPRFFSGWCDEGLMGKVVQMAGGQSFRQASSNVIQAWWPMFVERQRSA